MSDYEKKYKEALEVAKRKLCFDKAGMVDSFTPNDIYEMFPELKVSEDERIRKVLVDYFKIYKEQKECGIKTFYGIPADDILAWLEKQGEQKQEFNYPEFDSTDILAIQCCMRTAEKVTEDKELYDKLLSLHSRLYDACCLEKQGEHRQDPCKHCKMTYSTCYSFPCDEKKAFEQGKTALEAINEEKVDNANKDEIEIPFGAKDSELQEATYYIPKGFHAEIDGDKVVIRKGEKQDTQPRYNIGDVICDKSCTTLNKEAQPNMEIVDIQNGMYICDKGSFPVSQQDEYVLVGKKIDSKLNDNSVSNELRAASFAHAEKEMKSQTFPDNLKFELIYTFEEGAKWDAAQKSTWSKDDEYRTEKLLGWLNTLINYIQGDATVSLDLYRERKRQVEQLKTWFKSLKALNTWKPSDKQIIALKNFTRSVEERGYFSPYDDNIKLLYSLLSDLKKLRKE